MLASIALLEPVELAWSGLTIGFDPERASLFERSISGLIGAVIVSVGAVVCKWSIEPSRGPVSKQITLRSADPVLYGGVTVSVAKDTIEALCQRTCEAVQGVREASVHVQLHPNGWRLRCRLSVWHESALPKLTLEVERTCRHSIEHHTGIPVAELKLETQLSPIRSTVRVA